MPVQIQDGTIKTMFSWPADTLNPLSHYSHPTDENENILAGSGGSCTQEDHDGRQESFWKDEICWHFCFLHFMLGHPSLCSSLLSGIILVYKKWQSLLGSLAITYPGYSWLSLARPGPASLKFPAENQILPFTLSQPHLPTVLERLKQRAKKCTPDRASLGCIGVWPNSNPD